MNSSTSNSDPDVTGRTGSPGARENFRAFGGLFGRNLFLGGAFAAVFFVGTLVFLAGIRGSADGPESFVRDASLAGAGALLVATYFGFPNLRSSFRTIVFVTVAFVGIGEAYFRIHYFGADAIRKPIQYLPASADYPICQIPLSPWTHTGFAPNASTLFKGARFETNSFGFRDRERAIAKPPGTVRVLAIGASQWMGAGVNQDAVFTAVLEDQWNAGGGEVRFEVINLSRAAYVTVDFVHVLREWGMRLDPDLILVKGKASDRDAVLEIRTEAPSRWEKFASLYDYPYSVSFFAQALRDHVYYSVLGVAKVNIARARKGLPPVWKPNVALASEEDLIRVERVGRGGRGRLKRQGEFLRVAAGRPVYTVSMRKRGEEDLRIYPGDRHPSAKAHGIWAKELHEKLAATMARIGGRARDSSKGGGVQAPPETP